MNIHKRSRFCSQINFNLKIHEAVHVKPGVYSLTLIWFLRCTLCKSEILRLNACKPCGYTELSWHLWCGEEMCIDLCMGWNRIRSDLFLYLIGFSWEKLGLLFVPLNKLCYFDYSICKSDVLVQFFFIKNAVFDGECLYRSNTKKSFQMYT